jgi:hypothetical protein
MYGANMKFSEQTLSSDTTEWVGGIFRILRQVIMRKMAPG